MFQCERQVVEMLQSVVYTKRTIKWSSCLCSVLVSGLRRQFRRATDHQWKLVWLSRSDSLPIGTSRHSSNRCTWSVARD